MATELPNGVVIVDGSDPGGTLGLAYGSSVDNLIGAILDNRQIQTFRWANAAGRTEQEGMGDGDVGYQGDINEYYRFDATLDDWVPATLDQTLVVSDTTDYATATSSAKIATWSTQDYIAGGAPPLVSGTFTATKPGWYQSTAFARMAAGSGVSSILELRKNGAVLNASTGDSVTSYTIYASVSAGVYLAAGDTLEVWGARTSAGNISTRRWSIRRVGY